MIAVLTLGRIGARRGILQIQAEITAIVAAAVEVIESLLLVHHVDRVQRQAIGAGGVAAVTANRTNGGHTD